MLADRKFTDQDIHHNRKLLNLAEDYLKDYTGTFDYLLACRDLVLDGQSLNVSLARAVLNCMRQDPRAQHLLPESLPEPPKVERPKAKPRLELVKPYVPTRPAIIDVKVKWKKPFVLSTWRQAYLTHIVDIEKSFLRYFTGSGEYKFFVTTLCGSRLSSRHAIMSDTTQGRELCTGCQNNRKWY